MNPYEMVINKLGLTRTSLGDASYLYAILSLNQYTSGIYPRRTARAIRAGSIKNHYRRLPSHTLSKPLSPTANFFEGVLMINPYTHTIKRLKLDHNSTGDDSYIFAILSLMVLLYDDGWTGSMPPAEYARRMIGIRIGGCQAVREIDKVLHDAGLTGEW